MPNPNDAPPPSDGEDKSVRVRWLASDRAQTLANVLTIIVALAAIGLSVWEGFENRKHNRLSVLPHLEGGFRIERSSDSTFVVRLPLENTGLGPAVVENVLYFDDGKKVYDARQPDAQYSLYEEIQREVDKLPFDLGLGTLSLDEGAMLQAGAVHQFIQIEAPRLDTSDLFTPSLVRDSIFADRSFVFCYCSVYGEDCEQTHLGAEPPAEDICEF